jgi:hypothetical protein
MVELVDTQDLKSCDLKSRAGSIPALSTNKYTNTNAKVAQLVEHDLAKVGVASSNLVFRSKAFFTEGFYFKRFITCSDGGTGRHAGLKIL